MKYLRYPTAIKDNDYFVSLPKHFEFKLFGKLVQDLEALAATSCFDPKVSDSLKADFKLTKSLIRSRDNAGLSRLADRLSTQSTLKKRLIHCGADALAFYIQYQLSAFIKKYPFKGADTRTPAIKKFIAAEHRCFQFNTENYKALVRMDSTAHPIFGNCLEEIRADIEDLIGAIPDYGRVEERASHGPGVSLGPLYKQGKTTSYYKWSNLPYSVTEGAYDAAKRAIEQDPRWIGALDHWYRSRCGNFYAPIDLQDFWSRILTVVDGSRITSVPKTGLEDRTIAIEPLMNVYLQLGVDHEFKERLSRRWNCDLRTQQLNRDLAKIGAHCGFYATIDLRAASDTISLMICQMLLPPAWFDFLCDLRSPKGVLMGRKGSFEKISSMGNGFTFALESLLFMALVRHVKRRLKNHGKVAVFGDDIIVPTELAPALIELLEYCGFAINTEKSFIDGPFRESCGSDWFLQYNVRPVYLKSEVKNVMDLFYIHNIFYLKEQTFAWSWGTHFKETRAFVRKYIPKKFDMCFGQASETLDAYLFSERRSLGVGRDRFRIQITPKAVTFNRNTDFLFRKLMVSLKGTKAYYNRWDRKRKLTTGNSFDVTRKDHVQYYCTKHPIYC